MSVSLIYIRGSTPSTILRLPERVSEFTYVTALPFLHPNIDGRNLTPRSFDYVIKVMSSDCNTIAIGDASWSYKHIWSQLSTNRFVSPRASDSALSYTHRVHNGLMIAANDRTPYMTTHYWSQIYSILQLSWFAIDWMESIPRHSGDMNPRFHSPRARKCGRTEGWFV